VSLQITDIFDQVDAVTDPAWLDALPLANHFGRFLNAVAGMLFWILALVGVLSFAAH
jgi:hypothetical protein